MFFVFKLHKEISWWNCFVIAFV